MHILVWMQGMRLQDDTNLQTYQSHEKQTFCREDKYNHVQYPEKNTNILKKKKRIIRRHWFHIDETLSCNITCQTNFFFSAV